MKIAEFLFLVLALAFLRASVAADQETITFQGVYGSVTVTITENSVAVTDENGDTETFQGQVVYDEELGVVTATNEEGMILTINRDGYHGVGEDGYFVGNFGEDTIIAGNEDAVVYINDNGSITITSNSITIADELGQSFTVVGKVVRDEASESFTVTNAAGETLIVNTDGYVVVGEDGFIQVYFDKDQLNYGDEESTTFVYKDGQVRVTVDSVIFLDFDGTIIETIEGEVLLDPGTGEVTLVNENGVFTLTTEGYVWDTEDGYDEVFFDGRPATTVLYENDNTEVSYTAGDGDNVAVTQDSVTSIGEDDFDVTMEGEDGDCRSIPDIICGNLDYSVLCEILAAEETTHTDEYTLFAPSNAAFAKIEAFLYGLDEESLVGMILFHATRGSLQVSDMECGSLVEMLDGTPSRHSCQKSETGENILIQKGGANRRNHLLPQIILADIPACNGFIHFVDNVMLPNYIETFLQ